MQALLGQLPRRPPTVEPLLNQPHRPLPPPPVPHGWHIGEKHPIEPEEEQPHSEHHVGVRASHPHRQRQLEQEEPQQRDVEVAVAASRQKLQLQHHYELHCH